MSRRLPRSHRRVLAALRLASVGAPAKHLSEVTGLRPWRLYPALDQLERGGKIARTTDAHGRAYYSARRNP